MSGHLDNEEKKMIHETRLRLAEAIKALRRATELLERVTMDDADPYLFRAIQEELSLIEDLGFFRRRRVVPLTNRKLSFNGKP